MLKLEVVYLMLKILIDVNWREENNAIVIPEESVSRDNLLEGKRVILYEPGMECEAILRRGAVWPWVADIVEGTIKETPIDPEL